MGIWSSNISGGMVGENSPNTELGPPDRIIPSGLKDFI
jgi:hypothetical protein